MPGVTGMCQSCGRCARVRRVAPQLSDLLSAVTMHWEWGRRPGDLGGERGADWQCFSECDELHRIREDVHLPPLLCWRNAVERGKQSRVRLPWQDGWDY
jgi:hypothetical protein